MIYKRGGTFYGAAGMRICLGNGPGEGADFDEPYRTVDGRRS